MRRLLQRVASGAADCILGHAASALELEDIQVRMARLEQIESEREERGSMISLEIADASIVDPSIVVTPDVIAAIADVSEAAARLGSLRSQ